MRRITWLVLTLGIIIWPGCDTENDPDPDESTEEPFQDIKWEKDVTGQLNPFDLIRDPEHKAVSEIDFMDDAELVFVTRYQDKVYIYPLRYMGVEVVNEVVGGLYAAITYCPITKSSVAWNRQVGNDTLLLTASGYLLRENLMPLDLNSGSIWSQMRLVGMFGKHDRVNIHTLPMFETSWLTVKTFFPDASVFIHESLQKSAWASTGTFGVETNSERQFGILGRDEVEVFDPQLFSGESVLYTTVVQPGGNVVVAGSSEHQYVVAFRTNYSMTPLHGGFPIIMRDESGTDWNIFGDAVHGERKGEQLEAPTYYTASSWAWQALFDRVNEFNPS